MFSQNKNRLIYHHDAEEVWIESWGENSLRVRASLLSRMPEDDWALLPHDSGDAHICIGEKSAEIENGDVRAKIKNTGKITFYNRQGKILLEEYMRNLSDVWADKSEPDGFVSPLNIGAREWKPIAGGDYQLRLRFESDKDEKLYGMGQYQQPFLDLKGADLELSHRNAQASVPFLLSSKGYGFLWNNPAIGRAVFGKNMTSWQAESTKALDYWVTCGNPKAILSAYADATGHAPMMPDFAMGFWQCKLRYQTQDDLIHIAREYKRRGLPISVIVVDFFHWPYQGEWKFDPEYWPDPEGMIRELKAMSIELMVSVWPTVDEKSENYAEMTNEGYLVRTERGARSATFISGSVVFTDFTNPGAQIYVWNKVKDHYYDKGIHVFWLDEAEPEYGTYDYDHYRLHLGSNLQVGNVYPLCYAKAFYDGMTAAGQGNVINLIRCAWAGSQRYGALTWSGDVHSSFRSFREQFAAGLNMGIAGIPWWTTDIGGFYGGNPNDEAFRELFARWFAYAAFCPIMRLHGYREPFFPPLSDKGGGVFGSGADNEVWSFGDGVYCICEKYIRLREQMKPYITHVMAEANKTGAPVIRTLFFEFPEDERCWEIEDEYLFGSNILVAPILYEGQIKRDVYLPPGAKWGNFDTGENFTGGQTVEVDAPLDVIPIFLRDDMAIEMSNYE